MSEKARELEQLARDGLGAYERGDMETVLELLHPEIEVRRFAVLPNPEGGKSHEDFLAWTARWEEAWESFRSEILSVDVLDDGHVIAHARQRGSRRGQRRRGRDGGLLDVRVGRREDDPPRPLRQPRGGARGGAGGEGFESG